MKKQYKIQLPKGKKVTNTILYFEDGVMIVDAELENDFHNVMHDEVCGVFSRINNHWKEVLKANGVTREKIEEMAKESIKELEKDCPDIWNKMIQEYGEAICGKKEQKYEPKDGDFIFVESRLKPCVTKYSYIGIFHDIIKDDGFSTILLMYASLKDEGRLVCGNSIEPYINAEYIRPATEAEKKLLIDKLAKVNKRWNPETKTIEDARWRAKDGEPYSYLLFGDTDILVTSTTDTRMYKDDERFNSGNYFKTDSDAEKVAEQIREIFKNSKSE